MTYKLIIYNLNLDQFYYCITLNTSDCIVWMNVRQSLFFLINEWYWGGLCKSIFGVTKSGFMNRLLNWFQKVCQNLPRRDLTFFLARSSISKNRCMNNYLYVCKLKGWWLGLVIKLRRGYVRLLIIKLDKHFFYKSAYY